MSLAVYYSYFRISLGAVDARHVIGGATDRPAVPNS
jgi:hypothetical protein